MLEDNSFSTESETDSLTAFALHYWPLSWLAIINSIVSQQLQLFQYAVLNTKEGLRVYCMALGCHQENLQLGKRLSPLLDLRGFQQRPRTKGSFRKTRNCRCNLSSLLEQHTGKVVIIDNYDSFTYNLSQYLGSLGCDHFVTKNDEITIDELRKLQPRGILLSPGPGRPEDSGISLQVVTDLGPHLPLFGVCMGHQCIGQAFGGNVVRAPSGVMHGKSSPVFHKNVGTLQRLSNPFKAARYHSLVIEKDSCPDVLEVTAWTEDGTIMAIQHKKYSHIQGVQFHPESIITDYGMTIMENFISIL